MIDSAIMVLGIGGFVVAAIGFASHHWRKRHKHQWGAWQLANNSSEYQWRTCEDKTCNQHQVMDTWK